MKQREVKVVLLGDAGVGKSSMLQRFVMNSFDQTQQTTIGAAFMSKCYRYENMSIKFGIQQDKKNINRQHLYIIEAAIVVFDVNNKDSYISMKNWIEELQENADKNIINVIAANKSDLLEGINFDTREIDSYVKSINSVYKFTSAKNDIGIEELFHIISQKISKIQVKDDDEVFKFVQKKTQKKKKNCSC